MDRAHQEKNDIIKKKLISLERWLDSNYLKRLEFESKINDYEGYRDKPEKTFRGH